MEKSPAACAMDWSIHLEKSLRSKTPGKSIEAIEEIGKQLDWWNSESELSSAEYRMFGLIPGEDKLFLNSIFLRLADAFRLGDKKVKSAVVKLFLRIKKKRTRKRGGEGILSKGKLKNHLELLSRVKEVFEKGDSEERALSLLLFGAWAYFSNDCADIRYTVLSSLVTGDVREAKAALFAAGCLSELADDFANVFLEILTTVVLSPEISSDVKLAGARAFAKMWCPFSVGDKAYKTGLKLLMDSSEDHFSALMLISLSKIASRWMLLIPTQIELLTSFQSEERSLHMQATSLKCYSIIFARVVCNFPSTASTVNRLFVVLHRSDPHPTLQLEGLRVLHKILLFNISTIPCTEVSELFLKLLSLVKNVLQSSILSIRVLAVNVIADISGKVLGRADMVLGEAGRTLASQLFSFVVDHILDLVTPKASIQQSDVDVELEAKSLVNTLFNLVEKHSYLHCLLLNNICLFIDKLMKMVDVVKDAEISGPSNLIFYLSKIIVACLQRLEPTDAETGQVLNALKVRSEKICNCSYFDSHVSMAYFLILHMLSTFCMSRATEEIISISGKSSLSYVKSVLQSDKFTLDCAKKIMLGRNNYWYLYKTGKKAACQGAWSTCAFIFEELITTVESGLCLCWLKSLARFSDAEKQIQPFGLTDVENLVRAKNTLLTAKEILVESDMGNKFSFQKWFLTIRANSLKTVVDMIKLLKAQGPLVDSFMEVSFRMSKLAREFDFLSTSFIGIDRQSVMCVSVLALSCSLVAFTAGFSFLAQNDIISKFGKSEEPFFALLIEDLFGRFTDIDSKTRKNLMFLLKPFRNYKGSFLGRLRNRITYTSYEAVFLHKLTEYSVGEIFGLQNEAKGRARLDGGEVMSRVLSNGSQLLSDIISKLMLIPFRTPRHFFRVRPAVSSEIIAMNEDGQMIDGSSVLSGSHLSLNLSFQLKNMPVGGPPGPLNKAYCILNCEGRARLESSSQDHDIDELVDLNEKLLRYIVGSAHTRHGLHCAGPDDHLMVNECLCLELNERGRGFSTCTFDVSCFPVGSYRIKWLSGCVDSEGSYWSLLPVNSGPLFTIFDRM